MNKSSSYNNLLSRPTAHPRIVPGKLSIPLKKSEKKKLRDAVDQLQSSYTALEGQNRLHSDKLGDQESFVEH